MKLLLLALVMATQVPATQSAACDPPVAIDVEFLLDTSGSVRETNFVKMQDFVKSFAADFTIGPNDVQMGVTTFDSRPRNEFWMNDHLNIGSLNAAIDDIEYNAGNTDTAAALQYIRENAFTSDHGDRPDAANVLIVLTDGQSNDEAATLEVAAKLALEDYTVICVGIGDTVNMNELQAIASKPSNVFTVENFDELSFLLDQLQTTTCAEVDPCASNECQNGATCVSGEGSYTCRCANGFTGNRCQTGRPSFCRSNPCRNNGRCSNLANGYRCRCTTGWTGKNCQNSVNDCRSNSCLNGGTCVDLHRNFRCNCPAGFRGRRCETRENRCQPNPCANGQCVNQANNFVCRCLEGWTGRLCDTRADPCQPNRCRNGVCVARRPEGFTCQCNPGFRGTLCEIDINECESNPCQNGAQCVNMPNNYRCVCRRGYNGRRCENDIDNCLPGSCLNGGVCVDGLNTFRCDCPPGFTGPRCQININDCPPNRCQNQGTCRDLVNGFNCICRQGFTGDFCEIAPIRPDQQCRDWHRSQLGFLRTFAIWMRAMPGCPCDGRLVARNPRLRPFDSRPDMQCFLSFPGSFGGSGRRCCYRGGAFVVPNGNFLRSNPLINRGNFGTNDVIPRRWCCVESNLCHLFLQVRPLMGCVPTRPPFFGGGLGDPHIRTIDGANFAFNAIGEFVLLKNSEFELQARTCQYVSTAGEARQASVFCGFVAKSEVTGDKLQVELSEDGTELSVCINDDNVTVAYTTEGDEFSSVKEDLSVGRDGDELRASFFNFVIDINIRAGFSLLTFTLDIDGELNGFSGLLGNVDGDAGNDYAFRNGTTLTAEASERDLLQYGKTWKVSDSTSLFKYPDGLATADFTEEDFEPLILAEQDPADLAKAAEVCDGSRDQACLFDFLATGDEDLARSTRDVGDEIQNTVDLIDNTTPTIESNPGVLLATVGEEAFWRLNASDAEDGDAFVDVIFSPASMTIDPALSLGLWTPVDASPVRLGFVARDSLNATSPLLEIPIILCTGCSDGWGECDFDVTRTPREGDPESFSLASCVCQEFYSGDECADDFDGCQDNPCPAEVSCIDFTPFDHDDAGRAYDCGPCPEGYTTVLVSDVTAACNDIDECALDQDDCEQVCVNTPGGFECACEPGFQLDEESGTTCIRVPEPCTRLDRRCVQGAFCDAENRQCVCEEGTYGDGQFQCVGNTTQRLCMVSADPHVRTWDDARAEVNLPCWYRVARMRMSVGLAALFLDVDVLARNTLTEDGLFYIDEVKLVNTLVNTEFEETVEDEITFGIDSEQVSAAEGGNPWAYNTTMDWNDIGFRFLWDPVDMMATFVPSREDVTVTFRAFVRNQLPQIRKPGCGVTIPVSGVDLLDAASEQVCEEPGMGPDSLSDLATALELRPPSLLLLSYLLQQSDVVQFDRNACMNVKQTLRQCNKSPRLAVKLCGFILNNKRTRQCLQAAELDPMDVLDWCTVWSCQENLDRCDLVQSRISDNECFAPSYFLDIGCDVARLNAENDRLSDLEDQGPI